MSATEVSFYVTGGTLRHDAPSYVERQADRDVSEGLLAGEFCYVLTPRQIGKSSLMVRTASTLREQGVNVLALDLTAIGQNLTAEQWYDGLVVRMGRQLRLDEDLDRFWRDHERLGPCQRFFAAIRDVVLRQRAGPLAIFVDEIDAVRSLPFSTDEFFAAIRECYNRRAEDPELNRITFCLLGVATPSDLIRDTRTTPFNIGRRIELHDFTRAEAAALAQGLRRLPRGGNGSSAGSDLHEAMAALTAERLLTRILFWTGGHPYLTQRFCRAVADDTTVVDPAGVDRVCAELFLSSQARERDDNLLFVRERLLRSDADLASLLELYQRVRRGKTVLDDETSQLVSVLRLSGIVKARDGRLRERNRIYARAFDEDWIKAHMPDADLRRQREAFRRGVLRTTAISVVVVAAMTVTVLIAVDKATKASKALAQSYVSQAKTERTSGRSGQRLGSLRALEEARPYYANEMELRNEAMASFALVDLEKSSVPASLPSGTTAVALAQTLKHHALGDAQGTIRLVETESGRLTAELPAVGMPTTWLAVSPNGRFVAAQYGGADLHRLAVWDAKSGAAVLNFTNQVSPVALDFSSDSSKVAVGFPQGLVKIFTLPEGESFVSLPLRLLIEEARVPLCIRFDPSGSRLAESSRASQVVQIWNLTHQTSNSLFHPSPIVAMAWSPDGHHLATASENRALYLWDLRFPDKKREFSQAHSGAIIDLAFNSHGDLLASLGADMTLKLWVTATGRQMTHPLEGAPSGRLHFNKDGRRLGYAGVKSGIQVLNVIGPDHYRVFRALGEANAPFTSLGFSPEGRAVVAANDLGVFFWDAAAGRELSFLPLRATTFALVHPVRGDLLVSTPSGFYRWRQQALQDGTSLTLKFGSSECFDLPARLSRCAWGPAEAQAAVVHEDHVHFANTEGPSATSKLPFKGLFDALITSPDGKWLVTWMEDPNRLIEVWDLTAGRADAKPVQVIPGLRHFAFSPDGKFFVTCAAQQYQLWDTATWRDQKLALTPSSSGDSHCVVAFARAGRNGETLLALANSPTTLKLFRVSRELPVSLLELAMLESPDPKPLLALAFNADGSRLAAAAADQTVQVWNLAKIREELAHMKLEGALPVFAARSEGLLTVVLKPDPLDTEKPQKWQEVEVLTAALAGAPDPKGGAISGNLVRRGKCYLDLRRPLEARQDFGDALRLSPLDADLHELLRQATALIDKTTPDPGEAQGGSGPAGKD